MGLKLLILAALVLLTALVSVNANVCQGMHKILVTVQWQKNNEGVATAIYRQNSDPKRLRKATTQQRNSAHSLLDEWQRSGRPIGTKVGTQQKNDKIRLDLQGITQTKNYGNFNNFQLQINNFFNNPTSIAHLNIPGRLAGYNDRGYRRIMRAGLTYSLDQAATVWIFQQRIKRGQAVKCPIRGTSGK